MKKLTTLLLLLLVGCSDPDTARRALDGAGYTEIQITGWNWTGCAKNDTYSTGFKAKGPTGKPVEGVVCSGMLLKGATIRTF
jgi:hypothetical protein